MVSILCKGKLFSMQNKRRVQSAGHEPAKCAETRRDNNDLVKNG
jgi:hypothetical protein